MFGTFRGEKFLKLEFLISAILLMSALVFSFESKKYKIDSTIEKNYEQLVVFKDLCAKLDKSGGSQTEILDVIAGLNTLKEGDFVLKGDVELTLASAYVKLGDTQKAKDILGYLAGNGDDTITRADAVMTLAMRYINNEKSPSAAIALLEKYRSYFKGYRTDEYYLTLALQYNDIGNPVTAAQYISLASYIPDNYTDLYKRLTTLNWANYTRENKLKIIAMFYRLGLLKDATDLIGQYIAEFNPHPKEAETLLLELVTQTTKPYVADLLDRLAKNPQYEAVAGEMKPFLSGTAGTLQSDSAKVRGAYYYGLLSGLSGIKSYNSSLAMQYYSKFLDGDIDMDYAKKNLTLAIRNLLAYKKYADITNITMQTYRKLGIENGPDGIEKGISFWNGYSLYRYGKYDLALKEFEKSIAARPDDYFAENAKDYILKVLKEQKLSLEEYLSRLEYLYITVTDANQKLFYAKVLFSFRKGYGKEILREKIIGLISKQSYNPIYTYTDDLIRAFQMNANYTKFVIYMRIGFEDKAKAILSSAGINDPLVQQFFILREYISYRNFDYAASFMWEETRDSSLNDNFAFLPKDLRILYYPQPYEGEVQMALSRVINDQIDKNLIYAIIRAESLYMPKARSYVGAKGLMQLMPATANWMSASLLGKKDVDLYDTGLNILLGTAYLSDNIKAYGYISAIAAYNSGYSIIKKTKERYSPDNELILMEIIPYKETRDYIIKILRNYYRYSDIYDSEPLKVKSPPVKAII
ncbi:MAG: lytic transglycosylase domain-containing protein [Brevinematales bacterium]|nr:lytic transglycosylase domain-containing protein [Brevinematales bacterium]